MTSTQGLGNGLFVFLVAPAGLQPSEPLFGYANTLNNREIAERIDGHAFGAWVERDDQLHHVSFYPNLALQTDSSASRRARLLNVAFDGVNRVHWLNAIWGRRARSSA